MENKIKYGYDDINIVPEISSSIEHRSECKLESFLFTAPMSSVVNLDNICDFIGQGIIPIIPRNIPLVDRKFFMFSPLQNTSLFFIALSLEEVEKLLIKFPVEGILHPFHICIDIANGHMQKLLNTIYQFSKNI